VARDGRQHLDALLYEGVTDLGIRRRLRASGGFCNWHTWMLLEIRGARSGTAIIHEDLLGRLIEALRTAAAAPAPRRSWRTAAGRRARSRAREACPVCAEGAAAERRYLEALLAAGGDADLQLAYARSDGLCGPHALRAMALGQGGEGASWLAARTADKWLRLRDELGRFAAKHDHRHRAPFTPAEAAACERACEALSGAAGLFGNDLHR
jgi:hypothetical protein